MKLEYIGHSCFYFVSKNGTRLLIDPYDESVGFKVPEKEADILLITHDHFDHNNVKAVKGKPEIIKKAGEYNVKGIPIKAISFDHDDQGGAKRGNSLAFVWEMDDVKFCHLGDLGHALIEEQVQALGPVDVLMIPVGGHFTIGSQLAKKVSRMINPRVTLPMHYKANQTNSAKFPIEQMQNFLSGEPTRKMFDIPVPLDKDDLPRKPEAWVVMASH